MINFRLNLIYFLKEKKIIQHANIKILSSHNFDKFFLDDLIRII